MSRGRDTNAVLAALPFAATAALLLARLLPIRFAYRESPLGIVSLASEARYPHQQETFWWVASLLVAALVGWGLSRWLAGRPVAPRRQVLVEVPGVAALLGVLWLPTPLGVALALACVAALHFATRSGPPGAQPGDGERGRTDLSARGLALLCGVALLLSLALTGEFWANLWSVAHGFPDEARAMNGFPFMGEIGQHLAWANALRRGGFHGKDFFCLYGPLYDLGLVGAWKVLGRSIVAWDLYFSATRVVALAGLLVLTGLLLRRRWLLLLLPFLVPWINLRSGFAFIGMALLFGWLGTARKGFVVGAGLVAGTSLLYSQEFGLAFVLVAGLAFALQRAPAAAGLFVAGAASVVAPVFAWYAANDALLPMLREVVSYPAYIVAGYGKVAFPSLASLVPITLSEWGTRELLPYQLGYGVPVVCFGALLLALPVNRLDPRAPISSAKSLLDALRADPLRATLLLVAVFGTLAFRTALGRSDVKHMLGTVPAAALLLVVAVDRVAAHARAWPAPLVVWRLAALALLVAHAGFPAASTPLRDLRRDTATNLAIWRDGRRTVADPVVVGVAEWIRRHTGEGDPVLFLPNNGAYYYLTDRPNPIRFVMGHQLVTQAQRDEVLAELRARPPRYLVWDDGALRVDGLSDEQVFGKPLLDWLERHYVEEQRIGDVSIRRPR